MRQALIAIAIVGMLCVAAACSGGSGSTKAPAGGATASPDGAATDAPAGDGGTGSEADLETAARDSFQAFLEADDDTYFASLSEECRALGFGTVSERNSSRHGDIRRAGMDTTAIEVSSVAIDDFTGSSATVSLGLTGTQGNEFLEGLPHAWIFESSGWHWADCEPFSTAGGGGGDVGGSRPGDAIILGNVATIADWYVYLSYYLPDGNDLVAEGGNPPPPTGSVYVLPTMNFQYNGPDASSTLSDVMSIRLQSGSTVYDDPADCGPHPGALDPDIVAAPGEGGFGDVCHAVATGDVANVYVVVTDKATGTDHWFDPS
jgi:hypothetical protein